MKSRLLLIAMADSIHVARWLEQIKEEHLEVVLISSSPHRRIHERVRALIEGASGQNLTLRMPFLSKNMSLLLWLLDRFASDRLRGYLVSRTIRRFDPRVVHVLEFQHGGYMLNTVPDNRLANRVVAVTNYGSDIFWFSKFPKHKAKIRKLLLRADAYSAECARDEALARQLGFQGTISRIFPNTGGLTAETLKIGRESSVASGRKVILVKGYQNVFGRALVAIRALALISDSLKDYKIVIFSANLSTAISAFWYKLSKNLNVEVHLKGRLSHSEMLELFRVSRCYVGLSRSDGISTSLLEAMAMGAFPIQTGTACVAEWAKDGVSALILNDLKTALVVDSINKAITSDPLVDSAQVINSAIIEERYSSTVVGSSVREFYRELLDRYQD